MIANHDQGWAEKAMLRSDRIAINRPPSGSVPPCESKTCVRTSFGGQIVPLQKVMFWSVLSG